MIPLVNKTNSVAPSTLYPYGDMKDNPGDGSGNKVNRQFFDDYVQTFEVVANNPNPDPIIVAAYAGAAAAPNNLPDNASNGYQILQNLCSWMFGAVKSFIATQGMVNTGTDNVSYVTSLTLLNNLRNYVFTHIGASITDAIYALQTSVTAIVQAWEGSDTAYTHFTCTNGSFTGNPTVAVSWHKIGKTLVVNYTFSFVWDGGSTGNATFAYDLSSGPSFLTALSKPGVFLDAANPTSSQQIAIVTLVANNNLNFTIAMLTGANLTVGHTYSISDQIIVQTP